MLENDDTAGLGSSDESDRDGDSRSGVVVVTLFECQSVGKMLAIGYLHRRMKAVIREKVPGFLDVRLFVDWKHRSSRSVSLWSNLDALRLMGTVSQHVAASRLPARYGIETACGVFAYIGDWRTVLFGDSRWSSDSPLGVRYAEQARM